MAVNSFRRSPASPRGRNRGIYLAAIVIGTAALIAFQFAKRLPREEVGSHIAGHIVVVDGDTVRVNGQPYRLSGLDTPERGDRARCEGELRKAEEAAGRLRQLVATGSPDLQRIRCAGCEVDDEGTHACNYGRLCGRLLVGGRDVSRILIEEGLAHPYVCSGGRCPPRRPWC